MNRDQFLTAPYSAEAEASVERSLHTVLIHVRPHEVRQFLRTQWVADLSIDRPTAGTVEPDVERVDGAAISEGCGERGEVVGTASVTMEADHRNRPVPERAVGYGEAVVGEILDHVFSTATTQRTQRMRND